MTIWSSPLFKIGKWSINQSFSTFGLSIAHEIEGNKWNIILFLYIIRNYKIGEE